MEILIVVAMVFGGIGYVIDGGRQRSGHRIFVPPRAILPGYFGQMASAAASSAG